jgi:hypothetical protein
MGLISQAWHTAESEYLRTFLGAMAGIVATKDVKEYVLKRGAGAVRRVSLLRS